MKVFILDLFFYVWIILFIWSIKKLFAKSPSLSQLRNLSVLNTRKCHDMEFTLLLSESPQRNKKL